MSLPKISEKVGSYIFEWQKELMRIEVSRIRQHKDGRVVGEVLITTSAPGYSPHLHQAQFNFISSQSRAQLSKLMADRYDKVNWDEILEQLSVYVLDRVRRGEPVKILSSDNQVNPPDYLLWPVIPSHQPTVFFGEGGSGKGYLALFFAICATVPWLNNPLYLMPPPEPAPVLYLDYETDEDEIKWRIRRMVKGMNLPDVEIHYRRCFTPLPDDIEQVQQAVLDSKAKLIIIDSIGAACAADLNAAETDLTLFNALRRLNITSLLISHTSKEQITKRKTIYGSVFFYNYARSVWEVRKLQETGEDEFTVGLFHRKSNLSKLNPPIGAVITFGQETVEMKSCDVHTVAEFLETLSTSMRIEELLKLGPLPPKEIADELDISYHQVIVTLGRLKQKGKVTKSGDKWGLIYES